MEGLEQLKQLGFSQYEAQAYVTLLRENPLNGYELAKASGIPRANIYSVLQKLEEAGAVLRMAVPDGARYIPVPAAELLAKLKLRYQQSLESASASLEQISALPSMDTVLNLRGYAGLLEQARALIDGAQRSLLISIWPEEAVALAEPMQRALERGVQITTLCLRGCPQPCPACRGSVFRYALAPSGTRWLVLVADEAELLAGEVLSPENTSAVRTRQQMLVRLTGSYVQNSIALASILTGLGERLFTELDPQSIAALNALHPERRWLETMRGLLRDGAAEN